MATTAADTLEQRQQHKVELKQKNVAADGRDRKVLQDIGNIVTECAMEEKPLIQYVRRRATNKPIKEAANVGARAKSEVANVEKAFEKCHLNPDEIIVISSDEEDSDRKAAVKNPSRKVRTFTSVLTARSKAACGLANKPKEQIVDMDASDANNELAVVEYVDELYQFYKLSQDKGRVHDYMDSQVEINAKMRSILIDWLIELHRKFELMPETLYLTINIVDRYLSKNVVAKKELQLVGISSMLIASKYEEIWAPEVNDFVCISAKAYFEEQVLLMEKAILEKLEWYLTVPTPYVFLVRYIKASIPFDTEVENMAFFLSELGLMNYPTIILYSPSMLAASAVYAARCTLHRSPFWNATLRNYTGYSEYHLMDCAKLLASFHAEAPQTSLQAVYQKFASPEHKSVSLLPPARID